MSLPHQSCDKKVFTEAEKNKIEKILNEIFPKFSKNKNENCNISHNEVSSLIKKSIENCSKSIKYKHAEVFNKQKLNFSSNKINITQGQLGEDEDGEEYIEYAFKPRQYFLFSICQVCKRELKQLALPCKKCFMTYYCSMNHMTEDVEHKSFCSALVHLAQDQGGHIFNKAANLSAQSFRNLRIEMVKKCEMLLKRQLDLFEKEIILYPKICSEKSCREWRYSNLSVCDKCKQVAYCKNNMNHLDKQHSLWCNSFLIMKKLIALQSIYGNIEFEKPKMLQYIPIQDMEMKTVVKSLYQNQVIKDEMSLANITQIATAPLTAWFPMTFLKCFHEEVQTIHIIGAEIHFEANILEKWEYFFMHLLPRVKKLNIIFIGPELGVPESALELLSKFRMCEQCCKDAKNIKFSFENSLYHEYYKTTSYSKPDLICFFNPGLHRITGFNDCDTWGKTINAATKNNCPVIVTSYTEYESPLDLSRFLFESQRPINIILPPTRNPFASIRAERNFISDDMAPLMFKNYFYFLLE